MELERTIYVKCPYCKASNEMIVSPYFDRKQILCCVICKEDFVAEAIPKWSIRVGRIEIIKVEP